MVPRYLHGYGLIEAPLTDCVARLDGARRAGQSVLYRHPPGQPTSSSRETAVRYLSHLTYPATRWVLFGVNDEWTAAVNNLRDGSYFADSARMIASVCQTRMCRVVDYDPGRPRQVGDYQIRDGYPARIFELCNSEGPLRAICCVLDGDRWTFETSGDPLPVEVSFDYTARLKRDRFTSENLSTLLAWLGIDRPVPAVFATTETFFLLDERLQNTQWSAHVQAHACTSEQADDPGYRYLQRGLGWIPHMRTHARSVVSDMTRAVLLSPHLHDQAQPHLAAARRQLGEREFQHLASEVEAHLRQHGG